MPWQPDSEWFGAAVGVALVLLTAVVGMVALASWMARLRSKILPLRIGAGAAALPDEEPTVSAPVPESEPPLPSEPSWTEGRGRVVILVQRECDARHELERALDDSGLRVVVAGDVEAARRRFADLKRRVRLVIVDDAERTATLTDEFRAARPGLPFLTLAQPWSAATVLDEVRALLDA